MKFLTDLKTDKKLIAMIVAPVLLLAFYTYKVYQMGVDSGDRQAAVRYSKAEDALMKRIKKLETESADANLRAEEHRAGAEKIAQENALLRQQTEIAAQLLRETDARRRAESAARLNKIIEEKKNVIEKIQSDTDFDSNLCALCREFAGSGYKLSFCDRGDAICGGASNSGSR